MPFKVGDRIFALDGVCKGAFGVVTRVKNESTNYKSSLFEVVLNVTYDNGRKDSIFAGMLEHVETDPLNID